MKAVYPGSFDPVTSGHLDIINRALGLCEELIVAVVDNPNKKSLFSLAERVQILKAVLKDFPKIKITSFSGLLVNFLRREKIKVMIKGLRALSDFDAEFQMALLNRKLAPEMETIFLMTADKYAFLSSSAVKEIASLGGSVAGLVPPYVEKCLGEKFGGKDVTK